MSSIPRIFVEKILNSQNILTIEGSDARHLAVVLRLEIGDSVTLCDGSGREFSGTITAVTNQKSVTVSISQKINAVTNFNNNFNITLFQALIKGDKFEFVVQKAVELGVNKIVPVLCERCVSRPDPFSMSKKLERYNKIAKSAAEQSGRNIIPVVENCIAFDQSLIIMKSSDISFICYENEVEYSIKDILKEKKREKGNISFFIGPEGGISPHEYAEIKEYRIQTVSLGSRILRTETASLYVLSALDVLLDGF